MIPANVSLSYNAIQIATLIAFFVSYYVQYLLSRQKYHVDPIENVAWSTYGFSPYDFLLLSDAHLIAQLR